jgi:hypothetical protein
MTLLEHLLESGYEPENYIDILDSIAEAERDLADYKINPGRYDEQEMNFAELDLEDWNEALVEMRHGWLTNQSEEQLQVEADKIRQWVSEHPDGV